MMAKNVSKAGLTRRQKDKPNAERSVYLASLLDQISDALISTDMNFRVVEWNAAAENIYGWTSAEVLGQPLGDVIQTGYVDTTHEAVIKSVLELGTWKGKVTQHCKDGTHFSVLASVSLIKDQAGEPTGFVTVNRDITEFKQAEEALPSGEQKYSALFQKSAIPTVVAKFPELTCADVNEAFETTFGYTREEMLGKTTLEIGLTRAAPQPRIVAQFQQIGSLRAYEQENYTKFGEKLTVLLNVNTVEFGGQKYIITTMQDTTELKRAAEKLLVHQIDLDMQNEELRRTQLELEAARNRYLDLYDQIPVGCITVSEQGLIIEANLAAAVQLGVARSVLRQSRISQFIFIEDQDIYYLYRKQILEADEPTLPSKSCDLRMVKQDKTTFWSQLSAFAARADDGTLLLHISLADITERKQAEKALRVSEERFRLLANNIPDIIYSLDGEGNIVTVNSSAFERYGYTEQDSQGKPFLNFIHPEDREIVIVSFLKALEEQRKFTHGLQFRIVAENGSSYWFELNSQTRFDNDGRYLGEDGVLRDITDRKRAEEALHESQELFSLFMRYSPIYTFIHEVSPSESRALQSSDNYQLLLGISSVDMAGKTMAELFPPEFAAKITADDLAVIASGEVLILDEEFKGRNYTSIKFPIKQGGKTLLAGYTIDITERKQAEEALRVAEADYRAIFERASVGIFRSTVDGRFLKVNRIMEEMYGYPSPEEMIDDVKSIAEQIYAEPEVRRDLTRQLTEHGEVVGFESLDRRKDGSLFWTSMNVRVAKNMAGEILYYEGFVMDITGPKQAEDALKDLNEQLNLRILQVENLQAEMHEQALHDPLTGLHNRRYLDETLAREITRAGRENDPISIIMIDIDHFKTINDTYGHSVGDKFLVEIANLMKNHARGSDIVCRFGGEEFLLVLPGTDINSAVKRAEEIRIRCAELILQHAGKDLNLTMSFGVASYPEHGQAADELIIKADNAMYRSKQTGRNRVTAWVDEGSSEKIR